MKEQEMIQKVVNFFNTGNVSEVEYVFSPTYIDHQKPSFLTFDGPDEFKEIVKLARKSLSNLVVTVKDTIVEENKICARLNWKGNNKAGIAVERETIDILLIENGKITAHWGAEE